MNITKIKLENFKFFTQFTIENISPNAEIVLLVGPNGSGKSCIFDAFSYFAYMSKRNRETVDDEYYKKDSNKQFKIEIYDSNGVVIPRPSFTNRQINFYGRSSYRFTSKISRTSISTAAAGNVLSDLDSPANYSELDQRIENDIEKALGELLQAVQAKKGKTDIQIVEEVIGKVNDSLQAIFPESKLSLNRIIDPHSNPSSTKIDLEFKKGTSFFSFRNLSAGEKEVVDIIFNFHRRKDVWIKNGVYFIDEPELHINTKIQGALLNELHKLCKTINAQLWLATHSLGFLRKAQEIKNTNQDKVAVLEFSFDYADEATTISPIKGTRSEWRWIFQTALEDLIGLLAPKKIIYCEGGDPRASADSLKSPGLDERVYEKIFENEFSEIMFISNGGTADDGDLKRQEIALNVINRAFIDCEILVLRDLENEDREEWLKTNPKGRMLKRKELENYLFDAEILEKYCKNHGVDFVNVTSLPEDIIRDDIKSIRSAIMNQCVFRGTIEDFQLELAKLITPETNTYKELKSCII